MQSLAVVGGLSRDASKQLAVSGSASRDKSVPRLNCGDVDTCAEHCRNWLEAQSIACCVISAA